ncbi:transferase [Microcoleus sp. FACHB-1]|nr:transferase [Microcoleus sp. FACHB-1]
MHLPALPWSSNSHVYAEGDVSIDASAAIAPGVILRADPDSKIVIASGVCIGMGSVLHAHGGTLEVEAGANLGAGVLIIGKGKIGAHACIGAITTVWNSSIEPWQVVPAASVVGDKGRQISQPSPVSTHTPITTAPSVPDSPTSPTSGVNESDTYPSTFVNPTIDSYPTGQESLNGQATSNRTVTSDDEKQGYQPQEDTPTEPTAAQPTSEASQAVYGQGSLDRILKTLFPSNSSLNRPPEDA